jgi:hypothetical protein
MAFPIGAILGGIGAAKSLFGGGDKKPKTDGGTDWLGIANVGAGLLGGINQSQQQGQNVQLQRDQLAQQQRQFDATQKQQQGSQALSATQMDPLAQQRSRQKMALVEQLMKGASSPTLNAAGNKFEGGMKYSPEMFQQIASFYSPEARATAEQQFGGAANAASGGQYGTPNLAAMGYGAAAPTTGMPAVPTTPLPEMAGLPQRKRPFEDEDEFGSGVRY